MKVFCQRHMLHKHFIFSFNSKYRQTNGHAMEETDFRSPLSNFCKLETAKCTSIDY